MSTNQIEDVPVLMGEAAVDHMLERWGEITHGMVTVEVQDRWLIISRAGGDYTTFLSIVDGTAVTLTDAKDASVEDLPEDVCEPLATDRLSDDEIAMFERAFDAPSGGAYPLGAADAFALAYKEDDGMKQLLVGLLDDTLEVVDA